MTSAILVTGGTGVLGRQVVRRLRAAGDDVRVASRGRLPAVDGVDTVEFDLADGRGLPDALRGVTTVVHCAGGATGDGAKAERLVEAAREARIDHLVFISVVGADRIPVRSALDRAAFGYYAEKLRAEQAIAGSGIPWSTLRATQFHEFVTAGVDAVAKLPVLLLPRVRFQPIDSGEVADRLVELARDEPAGRVADIGGPEIRDFADLARVYLADRGIRRGVLRIPMPGGAAAAMAAGANLAPEHRTGRRTFEEFLASR